MNSLKGCPSYSKEEKWCRVYGSCIENCNIRKVYEFIKNNDIENAKNILENNSLQNT